LIPSPGAHGGDGARVAAALGLDPADVLDLSASLNPFAPGVAGVVGHHLDALGRYPDAVPATVALARAMEVDPDRLLLTNGGAEAIALVAARLGGHVEEPEFSLHPRRGVGPRWRSDPHNPTGSLAGADEEAGVWDEAFYAMATGRWTAGRDAVVVGSLTKLLACPGLRVGYVLAPATQVGLVAELARSQPAWSVNGLAAAALPELLDAVDLPGWAQRLAGARRDLTDLLAGHGLRPLPSDASWVLCAGGAGLRERLAPEGVVVRDCASFGLDGHARVAVPGPAGLDRLAAALERTR
jgi:histidinol-phosphate/aromatic aminotransferase/cobyric acid decarboxylase-like protein